ncbi:MAG: helix-turn-helix transcriptional regulator [Paraprevotella sp.]|nr:helix-turn-helix transcriptional regulator [Paraprevotella sp.]
MVFSEYMKNLREYQRVDIINDLMKLCLVSRPTVYRWINGKMKPSSVKRKIIAEYLNISEDRFVI